MGPSHVARATQGTTHKRQMNKGRKGNHHHLRAQRQPAPPTPSLTNKQTWRNEHRTPYLSESRLPSALGGGVLSPCSDVSLSNSNYKHQFLSLSMAMWSLFLPRFEPNQNDPIPNSARKMDGTGTNYNHHQRRQGTTHFDSKKKEEHVSAAGPSFLGLVGVFFPLFLCRKNYGRQTIPSFDGGRLSTSNTFAFYVLEEEKETWRPLSLWVVVHSLFGPISLGGGAHFPLFSQEIQVEW